LKKRILPKDIRVGIYNRVSHEDELQSLESQVHICKEYVAHYASSKNVIIKITHILTEKAGLSGKNANRPKYQELLYLIETKQIDWIVAKELSRLSRSTQDFAKLIELCHKSGTSIIVPSFEIDLNSPMSVAMAFISSVFAQLERELIVQRTVSGIRSLVITKQKIHGSPVVLGFAKHPTETGRWIVLEDEIQLVISIFRTFIQYKSFKCTLDALDKLGIRTKSSKRFNYQTLKRLLINRKYIGKLQVPNEDMEVDLPFGAPIPLDLFNEVQSIVASIDEELGAHLRNPSRVYLLSGLLFTILGNALSGTSAKGRDGKTRNYYRSQEEDLTLSCDEIEMLIIRVVEDICRNEGMKQYREEVKNNNEERITNLKRSILATHREIELLTSLKSKSLDNLMIDPSSLLMKEIEARILSINKQIEELTEIHTELSKKLENLHQTEESIDVLEQSIQKNNFVSNGLEDRKAVRGWLRGLFDKVVVDIESRKIQIFWKHQLTMGNQLLPYKVEIPVGSRRQAIKSTFDLEKNDIKESKLYELSVTKNLTSSQIAKELNVSRSTVSKYQKRYGIPTLPIGSNRKRVRGVKFGTRILSNGKVVSISEEQKTITAIQTWRNQGKSFREIADILNIQGISTKTGKGQWHGKTIHQLLN
jgi:DNA invertase Pin-like site-specific DNA recombinase